MIVTAVAEDPDQRAEAPAKPSGTVSGASGGAGLFAARPVGSGDLLRLHLAHRGRVPAGRRSRHCGCWRQKLGVTPEYLETGSTVARCRGARARSSPRLELRLRLDGEIVAARGSCAPRRRRRRTPTRAAADARTDRARARRRGRRQPRRGDQAPRAGDRSGRRHRRRRGRMCTRRSAAATRQAGRRSGRSSCSSAALEELARIAPEDHRRRAFASAPT